MILLSPNCLLFQFANGEAVPITAENISVQIAGGANVIEPEVVQHAAAAVVHYFKDELHRERVTAREFAGALEKVLHGFGFEIHAHNLGDADADLAALAQETDASELVFFPRLRLALRHQLDAAPKTIRFHGLRGCVKQLAGARRWSPRCEKLRDAIVDYLRECLRTERAAERMLVVE
ncbi:MAG: hypothetical protein RL380_771 [Verrucomicrobiota bacterium]|jgi:hypothetical protein